MLAIFLIFSDTLLFKYFSPWEDWWKVDSANKFNNMMTISSNYVIVLITIFQDVGNDEYYYSV